MESTLKVTREIADMRRELQRLDRRPVTLYVNNQTAVTMMQSVIVTKMRHKIRVKNHLIKDMIFRKLIDIFHAPALFKKAKIMTEANGRVSLLHARRPFIPFLWPTSTC